MNNNGTTDKALEGGKDQYGMTPDDWARLDAMTDDEVKILPPAPKILPKESCTSLNKKNRQCPDGAPCFLKTGDASSCPRYLPV